MTLQRDDRLEISLEDGLSRPDFALTKSVYDYWSGKCRGSEPPLRSGLDPIVDIPAAAPYLTLLDVHFGEDGEAADFQYRLIGTAIAEFEREDCTGRWLSEIMPDVDGRDAAAWKHHRAALTGSLWIRISTLAWMDRDEVTYRSLLLPISRGGDRTDMLLGHHFAANAKLMP